MQYLVIRKDKRSDDEYVEEFNDLDKAIETADETWENMSEADKDNTQILFVLDSVDPDEYSPDHYDGNIAYTVIWR